MFKLIQFVINFLFRTDYKKIEFTLVKEKGTNKKNIKR